MEKQKEPIRPIRTIRTLGFLYLRGIASYIVPKKKEYYAFYSTLYKNKFAGNVKALMLHITENNKEIKTVLLSLDKDIVFEAKNYGLRTKSTIFGMMWASLRAEHILIDSSKSGDFRWGRFSLIQLWHGSGFKDVGLLHYITDKQKRKLKKIYRKYNLISSTSESEAEKQNVSFATKNAVVTGYPRNDVFFEDKSHFNDLKIKYNLEEYDRIIAYTPTHREFEPPPPFSKEFYQKLQSFLEENNAVFIVKKHPSDKFLEIPKNFQNIKDLSFKFADVQELLLITDVLISDYSSIATDFALTKKPILIYPYDIVQYREVCRPMYYNIEEILPQPFIKNENDLLEKLKDDSWMKTTEAIQSYDHFIQTFHQYIDGNSSQRVLEAIHNLSGTKGLYKNNEILN